MSLEPIEGSAPTPYLGEDRRAPQDLVLGIQRHERRVDWHDPRDCKMLLDAETKFAKGDERMERMEGLIKDNTAKTESIASGVSEVLDILNLAKSFLRILGIIGEVVKWFALLAAPLVALWYTIKGGQK